MAKRDGQKKRILVLKKILESKTDEQHLLSVPHLLEELQKEEIPAERKSLYGDIDALIDSGMDINMQRGRSGGYYVGQRLFELPELKLLVDAVQASQFISKKKSEELITKLESFASKYQAKEMQRQVYVSGRVKNDNNGYYDVDTLHKAIDSDKQVSFFYTEWNMNKRLVRRKNGARYTVSPWALAYDNANYYLIAYTEEGIRHYRVDKMQKVEEVDLPRQGKKEFRRIDLGRYTRNTFGMFGGEAVPVTLRCSNKLVGVMLDRFGTSITIMPEDDDRFHFTVPVVPSSQFLGWCCGFGGDVEVTEPANVRTQMQELSNKLSEMYK